MNWTLYLIIAFLALAADASIVQTIAFRGLVPSLLSILVVFIAFFAPRTSVLFAAWVAGLAVDLSVEYVQGAGDVGPVLGPYALGFTAGAYLILLIRPLLLRRSVLTLAVMTVIFAGVAHVIVMSILSAHAWYDPVPIRWRTGSLAAESARRTGAVLYTGLCAIPLAAVMLATIDLWGFRGQTRSAVRG